jgi:hypothetical protein
LDDADESDSDQSVVSVIDTSLIMPGGGVLVRPQPKTPDVSIEDYLDYFQRVADANEWDDEKSARILPSLLEMKSRFLESFSSLDEDTKKSFKLLKEYIRKCDAPYRDSRMIELVRATKKPQETYEGFRDRILRLVETVYQSFAKSNKQSLARDFFLCGISDFMRGRIMSAGGVKKLEECVQLCLMNESVADSTVKFSKWNKTGGTLSPSSGSTGGATHGFPRSSGGSGHRQEKVQPRTCFNCGSEGHFKAACPMRKKVGVVNVEDNRIFVNLVINGLRVRCLADSGAQVSILPDNVFESDDDKTVQLRSVDNSAVQCRGSVVVRVGLRPALNTEGSEGAGVSGVVQHKFLVASTGEAICGADLMKKLGLTLDLGKGEVVSKVVSKGADGLNVNACNELSSSSKQVTQDAGGDGLFVLAQASVASGSGQLRCARVLAKYPALFSGIGKVSGTYHRIDTGNSAPVCRAGYRIPVHLKPKVQEAIDKLKNDGFIEESTSEYSSPIIVVNRKDSKEPRVCLDFRQLNGNTKKDALASPRIDVVLDRLVHAKVMSRLDIKSAYYNMEIHPDDRHKTAFRYEGQLFQWTRMAFGLTGAPATWNRLIHGVVGSLPFVANYFDDLIVFSQSESEHERHLDLTLEALSSAGLRLNRDKCHFFVTETDFLGFKVSYGTIKPTDEKVQVLKDFPRPKSVDEVKRFVGMIGYFRRLVCNFSARVEPLQKLSQKPSRNFAWDAACEKAFIELRDELTRSPVCQLFDPDLPTLIKTDASEMAMGGVLLQEYPDGSERVIEYFSKRFDKAQRNYSVIEKEACALISCVKKFKHYLVGKPFVLYTDQKPLIWIRQKRDVQGKLGRWCLFLEEFDYSIRHVKGVENTVADALSRIASVTLDDLQTPEGDDELSDLLTKEGYSLSDGVLCFDHPKRGKLIVPPKSLRVSLLKELHSHPLCGHCGSARTLVRVQERFFWPRMTKDVKDFCKSCHVCAVSKDTVKTSVAPMKTIDISGLSCFEKLGCDILGPLPTTSRGNRYVILVQDYFTKWVEGIAVPNVTSDVLERFLFEDVFCRYGIPSELITDQGTQMTCASMKSFCKGLGVKQRFTTPYHPQTDGLVERMNRSLLNTLRTCVAEDQSDWDLLIQPSLFSYRTSRHATTGVSPSEALQGRTLRLPIDVQLQTSVSPPMSMDALFSRMVEIRRTIRTSAEKKQEVQKKKYDEQKKVKKPAVQVGMLVYWTKPIVKKGLSPKLSPLRQGPFSVVETSRDGLTCTIVDEAGSKTVVHSNNLVISHSPQARGRLRKRGRPRKDQAAGDPI